MSRFEVYRAYAEKRRRLVRAADAAVDRAERDRLLAEVDELRFDARVELGLRRL